MKYARACLDLIYLIHQLTENDVAELLEYARACLDVDVSFEIRVPATYTSEHETYANEGEFEKTSRDVDMGMHCWTTFQGR